MYSHTLLIHIHPPIYPPHNLMPPPMPLPVWTHPSLCPQVSLLHTPPPQFPCPGHMPPGSRARPVHGEAWQESEACTEGAVQSRFHPWKAAAASCQPGVAELGGSAGLVAPSGSNEAALALSQAQPSSEPNSCYWGGQGLLCRIAGSWPGFPASLFLFHLKFSECKVQGALVQRWHPWFLCSVVPGASFHQELAQSLFERGCPVSFHHLWWQGVSGGNWENKGLGLEA